MAYLNLPPTNRRLVKALDELLCPRLFALTVDLELGVSTRKREHELARLLLLRQAAPYAKPAQVLTVMDNLTTTAHV